MASIMRKAALMAASATVMAGGVVVATGSTANAIIVDISNTSWGRSWGQPCGSGGMCLYYSQGLWNASWRPSWTADTDLSGNQFYDSGYFGSEGAGQIVDNNSASMGNRADYCYLYAYRGTNYTGDINWLQSGYAGNFTEGAGDYYMRNRVSSIKVTACV